MYPNLYYAFRDLFGVDWKFLHFINSFGFFVAIAFIICAVVLARELKRKEAQGLLKATEETRVVGKPATPTELLVNFLLAFLFGYKIVGLFISTSPLAENPADFMKSTEGSWPVGLLLGLLSAGYKWYEKNQQKLPKPEERKVRIWPHDRVGDITILAAAFGFLGAKLFNSFENWDDFVRNPLESLFGFDGLTYYGGLICAALAIWFYARKHQIGFWYLYDSAAPMLMLAYALGRVACQVSGDGDWGIINSAYSVNPDTLKPVLSNPETFTATLNRNRDLYMSQFGSLQQVPHLSVRAPSFLPDWLFAYPYPNNVIHEGIRIPGCEGTYCNYLPLPVFPTPFYETLVCLALFFLLWNFRKKFKVPGTLFAVYLVLNGIERFFIEKIRVNARYSIFGFHPTQAEIISFLLIVGGGVLYFVLNKRASNPVSRDGAMDAQIRNGER